MRRDKDSYDTLEKKEYNIINLQESKLKSSTAGFLLAFFAQCTQLRRERGFTWMRAQPECKVFDYKPIDIKEARSIVQTQLTRAMKDPQIDMPPAIFLDECVKIKEDEFLFNRSLIRSLGLALIIMSTNTDASNFVAHNSFGHSRIHINEDGSIDPWCYLVHELPPVSLSYLDREFFNEIYANLNNKAQEINASNISSQAINIVNSLKKLVDTFGLVIVAERPLFALYIVRQLSEFVKKINFDLEFKEASSVFLEKLFYFVFEKFYESKRCCGKLELVQTSMNSFSWGQVDFLQQRPDRDKLSLNLLLRFAVCLSPHVACSWFSERIISYGQVQAIYVKENSTMRKLFFCLFPSRLS